MGTLLIVIAILSLVAFIIGMFSPKTVLPAKWGQTRGKVALIYVCLFFVSGIIGSAVSPEVSDIPKTQASTTELSSDNSATIVKESNHEQAEHEEISSIGKEISVGYFTYVINGFKYKKSIGDESYEETADGIYLLIDVTVKNTNDETRTLDGSCFFVTDADNVKYDYSIDGSTALEFSGGKTLFLKQCQPNILTKGTLVFEVPAKGEYYIYLAGSMWGSKTVCVPLK